MVPEILLFWGSIAILSAVSIVLGTILGKLLLRIAAFFVGKTKTTLDDRIFAAIKMPVESFFFLIVFYLLIHDAPKYVGELSDLSAAATFLERYTFALLLLVGTYMASEATGAFLSWYYEEGHKGSRIKIDLSLLPFLRKFSKLVIYFIGITASLGAAGFDITGLIALSSVAGIVIGLASQETLANIFAGMALQLDRPYHYGDNVRFAGGETAKVKRIGLRSTILEDASGASIIISNSELAKQRMTNLTHPDHPLQISFVAEVPLGSDLKKLHAHLGHALSMEKPQGYGQNSLQINVERIREKTAELSISFSISDFPHAASVRFFLNGKILEFLKKGPKK
ncbi:Small-conductance mechanosensitive channel MscMJ [Candidatus Anstonella stagnisolia]|nr:Small-conductance mechanosensitive channel MscMJ [Candidatus Anstonella stagnisolia]